MPFTYCIVIKEIKILTPAEAFHSLFAGMFASPPMCGVYKKCLFPLCEKKINCHSSTPKIGFLCLNQQ